MNTYPIIHFPERTIQFQDDFPKLLLKKYEKQNLIEPKFPTSPTSPAFEFYWVIFCALGVGVPVYLITRDSSIANPSFVVGLIVYPIVHLIRKYNYENSIIEYNENCKTYNKLYSEYSMQKTKIDNEKTMIRENIKDFNWLETEYKKQLSGRLKPLKSALIEYRNPQRGKAERLFYDYLNRIFHDEIFIDKVIEIFTYRDKGDTYPNNVNDSNAYKFLKTQNAYCPDFIFIHGETKLTINIEIDEPYNQAEKPIHIRYNEHDEKRNKYFTDFNWYIIRFSERQITKNAESCCIEIANLIFDLTGDEKYFARIKTGNLISRERTWTYNEAVEFTKQKKRKMYDDFDETYLKIDTKLFLSPLKCGKQRYIFSKDFKFIESDLHNSNVTDKGKYEIYKTIYKRRAIVIYWKDGFTNYYLNQLDSNNLIFTEVKTGIQFIFERQS